MEENNNLLQGLILVVIVVFVLIAINRRTGEKNRIYENHVVVCGDIENVNEGRGGNYLIKYSYYYSSAKYSASDFCSKIVYNRFTNGHKKIFIAIEKGKPSNSKILQDTTDFERLNILKTDTVGLNCGNVGSVSQ